MQHVKRHLLTLGGFLVTLSLFAFVLILPARGWIGRTIRYGFGLWLVLVGLLFYFAYSTRNKWLVAILISLFCTFSLSGLWVNKYNDLQVFSGFLFFSDAAQYYEDALRLLEGFSISTFSGRHPLSTIFIGILLWFVNGNLQFMLIVITVIVASCLIALGNSVASLVNPLAAALLSTLVLLFYRRFTGLLNSEHLGLALGCLSLVFLLHAAALQNPREGLSGLLFLGLAIAARPGAFLILAITLLWVTKNIPFFPNRWSASFCMSLLAVSTGFALTVLCNHVLAEKGTVAFSNYSYSLYGMVLGDRGWEQFTLDHADILSLPAPHVEAIAFQKTFQAVLTDPLLGLRGWGSAYLRYFTTGPESLFGFVASGETVSFGTSESPEVIYFLVRLALFSLTALGMLTLWRNKANLSHSLLFWSGVATLSGIAFIPARDASMMRIHAASIPFLLCLPSVGLVSLLSKKPAVKEKTMTGNPYNFLAYSLLAILLTSVPLFGLFVQKQNFSDVVSHCAADQVSALIRMSRGSYIKIVKDEQMIPLGDPLIHHSDFLERLNEFYRPGLLKDLMQSPPDTMLMFFLDLRSGQSAWLIQPMAQSLTPGDVVEVCGKWHPGMLAKGLGFLQVEQSHLLRSNK